MWNSLAEVESPRISEILIYIILYHFRNSWTIFIFLKLYKHFLLKIKFMNFVN